MEPTKDILQMEALAEAEGFVKGTKAFDDRMVYLKVQWCQEKRGVTCNNCDVMMFCPLTAELFKIRTATAQKEKK